MGRYSSLTFGVALLSLMQKFFITHYLLTESHQTGTPEFAKGPDVDPRGDPNLKILRTPLRGLRSSERRLAGLYEPPVIQRYD